MTSLAIRIAAALSVLAALTNFAAAAGGYAVFKSVDEGETWIRSDGGLIGRYRINAFGSAPGVLLAGTDAGIQVSEDDARGWRPATGEGIASARIISFANLGRNVFAGSERSGMFVSRDGGLSWASVDSFPARKMRCLLEVSDKLYAGTDAEGMFSSEDAGRTWTQCSKGLPSGAQIFTMAAAQGSLFAGLYSRGLYAWDQQKSFWSKVADVKPLALASVGGTLVAGHNPGGLYWSGDLGNTWSKGHATVKADSTISPEFEAEAGEFPANAAVWDLASNARVVFAGAAAGIYISRDEGRTWTRARGGVPSECPGIAFLVKRDLVLAAVPMKEGDGKSDGAAKAGQPLRPDTN